MISINISLQGNFEVTFEFAMIRTCYKFSSEMRFFLLHGILGIIYSLRIRELLFFNLRKSKMKEINLFFVTSVTDSLPIFFLFVRCPISEL